MTINASLAAICILFLAAASATGGSAQQSLGDEGEPEVTEGEVIAPASDWDDAVPWGGNPPPWFEDPASVECGGRKACEQEITGELEERDAA